MDNRTGQLIELCWDDGYGKPESFHLYGHVPMDAVAMAVAEQYDGDDSVPVLGEAVWRWGAWRFDGVDEDGKHRRTLRTFKESGRGRFPMTMADVTEWREAPRG